MRTSSLLDLRSVLIIAFSCCNQNSQIALWVSGKSECLGFHFFCAFDYSRYLQDAVTCICIHDIPLKTTLSVYHWGYPSASFLFWLSLRSAVTLRKIFVRKVSWDWTCLFWCRLSSSTITSSKSFWFKLSALTVSWVFSSII